MKKMSYEEKIKKNLVEFRKLIQIDSNTIDHYILPAAAEYIEDINNFYDEEDRQEQIKAMRRAMANFDFDEDKYAIVAESGQYYSPWYEGHYRRVCPFIWQWAQCVHIMKKREQQK